MSDRIFLMNQGRSQSGDAETSTPRLDDLPGFIGNYNLLDADRPAACCSARSAGVSRFARSPSS
jgi:hypothetical protein